LNGAHQLLVYAYNVHLLKENIHTIKKNRKALLVSSREIGLEVNPEKTRHISMPHEQNAVQNHNKNIGNKSSEGAAKFKYLGTILLKQNCIHEENNSIHTFVF